MFPKFNISQNPELQIPAYLLMLSITALLIKYTSSVYFIFRIVVNIFKNWEVLLIKIQLESKTIEQTLP